ncbi:MAG TPA: glycosyltransferase [Polyangia bacterium]|nr:glycosyltransferase [Polyangia bacterium]
MPPPPTVSIVIPAHNQWAYTVRCLVALLDHSRDVSHEVIVVDNGSSDETPSGLASLPAVRVHRNPQNLGFGRACNQGASLARGELVLFLNNDAEPRRGWLSALVSAVGADPAVAIAGSRLLFPDDRLQSAGLLLAYGFPYPLSVIPRAYNKPAAQCPPSGIVRAVSGACMVVRAAAFRDAGGFDDGFSNGYEDVDLCLRVAERGGKTLFVAESLVTHHEAVSGGRFKNEAANLDLLQRRWIDRLPAEWYDLDYRRQAAQAPARAGRPGATAVVVAQDAIATIAPCLENLRSTLGPDDELVIVDDGSRGASARFLECFARAHPDRVRLLVVPEARGFSGAARLGVADARRDFVAVLAPNVKVAAGWLDKLVGYLEKDPALGVVGPGLSGRGAGLGSDAAAGPLYPPPPRYPSPGASVLDKLVTARPRAVRVAPSGCLVGRRVLMAELASVPDLLFGPSTTALAEHLARGGKKLGQANDVFVRRFNQLGGDHHGPDRARYLELQDAPAGYPGQTALVSVVILVRDNLALTRACIDSIYRHTPGAIELVLVDNGSSEDVAGMARELAAAGRRVVYLRNARNEGFAYGCNQGIAAAHGDYLVLLNNDVVVSAGWLRRQLALLAMDRTIALVGPTTNATSGAQLVGTATYRGVDEVDRFARQWALEHAGEFAIVPRIVGLCLVMRRSLVAEVGGFDTAFGFGNCEDDDLCVRIQRAGHKIAIAYDVFIHHHGSATFRALDLDARALCDENWRIFCAKWRHPAHAQGSDALAALARAQPFDGARDRIPVEYDLIFHAGAPPLALATTRPTRVLCIPDFRPARAAAGLTPAGTGASGSAAGAPGWRAALARFFSLYGAGDPVALVVRVEPPTPQGAAQAAEAVRGLLRELSIPVERAPEILIEATPLPPARRGSLYTAAKAFLSCGGARDQFYRREALACGLSIAELDTQDERALAPAPAVSVIIPTFNRPHLLELAVRSVLAQTFQDFEVIVVNDAGTSVADVIARLAGGPRVRCIDNLTRRGHGGSRNAGIRAARGRYLSYLDDDDAFLPDHLATLVGALADGRHAVVYSDAERATVTAEGRVVARDIPYASDFDPDALLFTNYIPILCVLHRRECVEAVAGPGGALFDETLPVLEDWDLWIRLSRRFPFLRVPRVTCVFTARTDGSSVTTERGRQFAETERMLRHRYRDQIAGSPRALQALYQSEAPRRDALLAAGRSATVALELAVFLAIYPECVEARRDLAALGQDGRAPDPQNLPVRVRS